jgi:hypothetical protein
VELDKTVDDALQGAEPVGLGRERGRICAGKDGFYGQLLERAHPLWAKYSSEWKCLWACRWADLIQYFGRNQTICLK